MFSLLFIFLSELPVQDAENHGGAVYGAARGVDDLLANLVHVLPLQTLNERLAERHPRDAPTPPCCGKAKVVHFLPRLRFVQSPGELRQGREPAKRSEVGCLVGVLRVGPHRFQSAVALFQHVVCDAAEGLVGVHHFFEFKKK
jgi:hypothetical protein